MSSFCSFCSPCDPNSTKAGPSCAWGDSGSFHWDRLGCSSCKVGPAGKCWHSGNGPATDSSLIWSLKTQTSRLTGSYHCLIGKWVTCDLYPWQYPWISHGYPSQLPPISYIYQLSDKLLPQSTPLKWFRMKENRGPEKSPWKYHLPFWVCENLSDGKDQVCPWVRALVFRWSSKEVTQLSTLSFSVSHLYRNLVFSERGFSCPLYQILCLIFTPCFPRKLHPLIFVLESS